MTLLVILSGTLTVSILFDSLVELERIEANNDTVEYEDPIHGFELQYPAGWFKIDQGLDDLNATVAFFYPKDEGIYHLYSIQLSWAFDNCNIPVIAAIRPPSRAEIMRIIKSPLTTFMTGIIAEIPKVRT